MTDVNWKIKFPNTTSTIYPFVVDDGWVISCWGLLPCWTSLSFCSGWLVSSRKGSPNFQADTSCQISNGTGLEMKCATNGMYLKHSKTIPLTSGPWKNCLPGNHEISPWCPKVWGLLLQDTYWWVERLTHRIGMASTLSNNARWCFRGVIPVYVPTSSV